LFTKDRHYTSFKSWRS